MLGRTPGERAFDRCFLPLVALFTVNGLVGLITRQRRPLGVVLTETELAAQLPPPAWEQWLPFAVGLIAAGLWLRGFLSLELSSILRTGL